MTTIPEHLHFIDKKHSKWSFLSANDGFKSVRKGHYAFHCEALTAFPIIGDTFEARELCELNLIPFRKNIPMSFATKKNSPFLKILSSK